MIYNSQDMEASSAEEWLKMRYIYTMEYYSTIKKNKIMSFAATWLDLEIVRAEDRQRKTSVTQYHLYVESKKKNKTQMNIFTKQTDSD